MILKITIPTLLIITSCPVFGQEVKPIEEVIITPRNEKENSIVIELSADKIQNKLANDLGQLLTLFPGLQVKNYGDVGGLKTVSFRSLGAGHTALVQDFTSLSTTQSGQADLSNIPADFVEKIELITLSPTRTDIPIHAKLAGAVVNVESVHSYSGMNQKKIIVGAQAGSFDQYEGYLMLQKRFKKWAGTLSGKIRSYGGSYPYTYLNGNTTTREHRQNNSLLEYFGTGSIHFSPNQNHQFQLRISGNDYKKELAGAVIFYNSNAAQYLNGYGLNGSLNHRFKKNNWSVFSSVNYQKNNLQYLDSTYLNSLGYLDQRFYATQLDFQSQVAYSITKKIDILLGSSFISESLDGKSLNGNPFRNSSESIIGFEWKAVGRILAQVGAQGIFEKRDSILKTQWNLLPAVSWSFDLGKKNKLSLVYRYTCRQPTFSELYYQQIGNTKLRTEKAHIASIRYELVLPFKKGVSQTMIQPFYSYINDKILAIPTKNLFIWSIQNIGKSDAAGIEFTQFIQKKIKNHTLGARVNYTFQYTQDLSDSKSSTYRDILSYSPLHSGSLELDYSWKKFSCFVLLSYLGERYALNQNIPSNLLDDYLLLDAGVAYTQQLKQNELTIRLTVNNITNQQYNYINYFVMPGTHFNIRLQYAL
ncbi:TonB-dependent receptor plug domain-containing protein [Fluviicola taffensis]|uniref:TonB-dependent receptor plug n=1 Tax=Fluviicola taffensis (strain DSM 16823 / NCIMB 13979 / RW262) TaxID=755732 RepID=F2I9N4_FLUTR|nr:TonB-dependent receptor plug domain-containing protein [Fluviicola taffensis]AEA42027.1 TonB-dependent receptor plug [Fluviicola taffensis DSM 16823]